jgi:hypothetical protein
MCLLGGACTHAVHNPEYFKLKLPGAQEKEMAQRLTWGISLVKSVLDRDVHHEYTHVCT